MPYFIKHIKIMMTTQLKRKSRQIIFAVVFIQKIVLTRYTNGQFHMGTNSKPLLEKLGAPVRQQLRAPGHYYYVDKVGKLKSYRNYIFVLLNNFSCSNGTFYTLYSELFPHIFDFTVIFRI